MAFASSFVDDLFSLDQTDERERSRAYAGKLLVGVTLQTVEVHQTVVENATRLVQQNVVPTRNNHSTGLHFDNMPLVSA